MALAIAALAVGCGREDAQTPSDPERTRPFTPYSGEKVGSAARDRGPARLEPARCPPGLSGCRVATGRIVFVEAVDPDGDGDAHFVIADPQGLSLPGLTAIDVRPDLRPDPLPGLGTRISAAGQVQTGSYGQNQIHAEELNAAGR